MDQRARVRQAFLLIAIPCLISAAVLTFMSPQFFGTPPDEFYSVWPALRLLRGDVPYLDVFTHRPPLDVLLNALALSVLGETLTASRLLQTLTLVASGYLLFALLRRWGANHWEAAGAALCPALLCFPFWPTPSSHWQALPLGLAAILLLESARREEGPSQLGRVASAGALAGLTGLTIQTEGAVVCVWLALRILSGPNPRRELPPLLAGIALPLFGCAVVLWAGGALGAAYECLVVFPLFRYKPGFNDVSVLESVQTTFTFARGRYGGVGALWMAISLALPLGALGTSALRLYRERTRRNLASLTWLLVIFAVFLKGRSDWVHFAFFLPYFLVGWFEGELRSEGASPTRKAAWAWLALALFLTSWLLVNSWSEGIYPAQALDLDRGYRQRTQQVLATLPPDLQEAPLLSLPFGSTVYFFRKSKAPRIDWAFPLSEGYTLPEEHQALATWLEEEQVPVVILRRSRHGTGFLLEEGPLKEPLQGFQLHAKVGTSLVLVRRSLLPNPAPQSPPR